MFRPLNKSRPLLTAAAAMVSLAVLTGCGAQAAEQAAEPTPSAKAAPNTPPRSPTAGAAKDSATTLTETDTESAPAADSAAAVLATLPVKGRAPMTGYHRDRFGQAWLDADRNGCDTRNDILGEFLTAATYKPGSGDCAVLEGDLDDPYTGTDIHFVYGNGALVDIDHVVALGNVWVTGGFGWDIRKRAAIANDPMNLLPVDASANRQKGDGDAATWLPSNKRYRCAYVARQIGVKEKYNLWVTAPEKAAMERVLSTCPGQPVFEDSGAPVRVTLNITDSGAARARSNTQSGTEATGQPEGNGSVYYENCEAARAADAAPVRRGDPGYGSHLDRDGDGSACE